MRKVIITLWLFWLETLAFIGFVYWSILARDSDAPFTTYHKITLIVYALALLITLYGTWLFIRRRFSPIKTT
ncbi:MAG: hypothetical protein HOP19_23125 [Acidobacteria bacterium]|nr:hypothetical protein [Acidobacteriota bacterium]